METKTCSKCHQEKSIEDIFPDRIQCRECVRVYRAQYRKENYDRLKDKYNERQRKRLSYPKTASSVSNATEFFHLINSVDTLIQIEYGKLVKTVPLK